MIEITQTCDGCGKTRPLKDSVVHIRAAGEQGGWREVRDGQHLCNICIRDALTKLERL